MQRIISAFWHAQHADGMDRAEWGVMRASIAPYEKSMLMWAREHGTSQSKVGNPPTLLFTHLKGMKGMRAGSHFVAV